MNGSGHRGTRAYSRRRTGWAVAGILLPSLAALPAGAGSAPNATAAPMNAQDQVIQNVGLDQKLNAAVPLELPFRDETGKAVRLGDYFGKKPVMLMLIQFRCTMLCTEEMNVLLESMKELKFTPGKEFDLLIVSIDPREDAELAAMKKENYLKEYGRPEAAAGWHWLTGEDSSIKPLAAAIGYRYEYDKATDQFAHPDGVIIVTPAGKTARYYFKLNYAPRDLRFGLIDAAAERIGTPLDAFALLCYHYNPVTGKYGLALIKIMRLVALATVTLLAVAILVMSRRGTGAPRHALGG